MDLNNIAGFKFEYLSDLEWQVINLGICPKCRQKKLNKVVDNNTQRTYQCGNCLKVFMMEPD